MIIVLVFLVSFLYVYRFDIDKDEFENVDPDYDIIPITSDNIGLNVYLSVGASNVTLLDIYETPHPDPYIDISIIYTTEPSGLSFRLIDSNGGLVSGNPSVIKEEDNFTRYRYPFTNNGSEKYTLQYSLGSAVSNVSNIYVQRVDFKISVLT